MTSSLYLGLQHASGALQPWSRLTTGRPAAMGESSIVPTIGRAMAALVGCQAAIVAPSTLHAAVDLFEAFTSPETVVFLDEAAYPILHWGAERAALRGVPVVKFPAHDVEALERRMTVHRGPPLIVTDGVCPSCGHMSPLGAYAELAAARHGRVIVDDTQALGILGDAPGSDNPYGHGGGGSLRWAGIELTPTIVVASLAKALGVPIAFVAGRARDIQRLRQRGPTRTHCSAPDSASLYAASEALDLNDREGETLRRTLLHNVQWLREQLARSRVPLPPNVFPFQRLPYPHGAHAQQAQRDLERAGVRVALTGGIDESRAARLTLLVTAAHTREALDRAATAIARIVGRCAHRHTKHQPS